MLAAASREQRPMERKSTTANSACCLENSSNNRSLFGKEPVPGEDRTSGNKTGGETSGENHCARDLEKTWASGEHEMKPLQTTTRKGRRWAWDRGGGEQREEYSNGRRGRRHLTDRGFRLRRPENES